MERRYLSNEPSDTRREQHWSGWIGNGAWGGRSTGVGPGGRPGLWDSLCRNVLEFLQDQDNIEIDIGENIIGLFDIYVSPKSTDGQVSRIDNDNYGKKMTLPASFSISRLPCLIVKKNETGSPISVIKIEQKIPDENPNII